MNIEDFRRVEALALAREHLLSIQHRRIELTLGGEHQSRRVIEAIAPAVRLAIRREVDEINLQLQALGVSTD